MKQETRFNAQCELRAGFDGNRREVHGLALPYNDLSEPIAGVFREKFAPNALDLSRNVFSLWSHDTSQPLGCTGNSTLKLSNRSDGLFFTLSVSETRLGDEVLTNIRSGLVSGVSVGFFIEPDGSKQAGIADDGLPIQEVTRAVLIELSPCIMPAYSQTDISAARSTGELLRGSLGMVAAAARRRRLTMLELG